VPELASSHAQKSYLELHLLKKQRQPKMGDRRQTDVLKTMNTRLIEEIKI
jgi:hypothetical protein